MNLNALTAISPADGRYRKTTEVLSNYFSEFALIRYRILVEIEYFIALTEIPLPQLKDVPADAIKTLRSVVENFSTEQAERVKTIEKTTNHDVKAVEYFLKEQFDLIGLSSYKEFIHFGLTSQDINNTALPLSLKDAVNAVYLPVMEQLTVKLRELATEWRDVPMLAHTHGQPASPTRLGKEFMVFVERIELQLEQVRQVQPDAKFGGATGNLNAHAVAYPKIDWHDFANRFLTEKLNLSRSHYTTQISHYDNHAALFDAIRRVNTILIDLDRDMWSYISMNYFRQKIKAGEVGSSTMPHKVNPIDFENGEGNFGIANAAFAHLSEKLPISRLQRDLTDSTVTRFVGVPFAHTMIAVQSTLRGLNKLLLNPQAISADLEGNWAVVGEAIQTILRREGYPNPYEALKELTRVNTNVTRETLSAFIETLKISDSVKHEMKQITPQNYTGIY